MTEDELPLFRSKTDGKSTARNSERNFSKYIVYVDESGDHGMQSLDEQYPLFVLAFCVFHKKHYGEKVVPALESFKFKYFGHDQVVLHEQEIRKEKGAFTIFRSRDEKNAFLDELTTIIDRSHFILISCVIDKRRLPAQPGTPQNPYHIALGHCLDALYEFLKEKGEQESITHVVVECRGPKEDAELELEFRRYNDGNNSYNKTLPLKILFSDKKVMSSGLQLADLVARPIGLHILRPEQSNRAFDVLKQKFYCAGGREKVGQDYENWGLNPSCPKKRKAPMKLTEAVAPTRNPQSTCLQNTK